MHMSLNGTQSIYGIWFYHYFTKSNYIIVYTLQLSIKNLR